MSNLDYQTYIVQRITVGSKLIKVLKVFNVLNDICGFFTWSVGQTLAKSLLVEALPKFVSMKLVLYKSLVANFKTKLGKIILQSRLSQSGDIWPVVLQI